MNKIKKLYFISLSNKMNEIIQYNFYRSIIKISKYMNLNSAMIESSEEAKLIFKANVEILDKLDELNLILKKKIEEFILQNFQD